MSAKIVSDNKSGETPATFKTGPQSGNSVMELSKTSNDILNASQINEKFSETYKSLPANQETELSKVIKYLGSSYSGVDIKVIAHMYDTAQWRDNEIKKLEDELAIVQDIIQGASSLAFSFSSFLTKDTTSYDNRRSLFIRSTGLNDSTQPEALRQLIVQVFRNGNFSFLGVAGMRRNNDSLLQAMKSQRVELDNKIKTLREIKSESSTTVPLGTLQTISVQSHREKYAVRALGHSYAKGYTRGTRTIAGSMIFTIFNEHALLHLIRSMGVSQTYGERDTDLSSLLPDQLPPIDITIIFANEYGSLSDFRLYGVEFVNDGATYSIEDLLSEQVINFICRDADIMTSRGKVRLSRLQQKGTFNTTEKDVSGSSLMFDNPSYHEYLDKLRIRRTAKNR
jgi:hypothetical protein